MTRDEAITLKRGIVGMDWSSIPKAECLAFGQAFNSLCAYANGAAPLQDAAPFWVSEAPLIIVSVAEAQTALEHLKAWRDGEVLLSASRHAQVKVLCENLVERVAHEHLAFAQGTRIARLRK